MKAFGGWKGNKVEKDVKEITGKGKNGRLCRF